MKSELSCLSNRFAKEITGVCFLHSTYFGALKSCFYIYAWHTFADIRFFSTSDCRLAFRSVCYTVLHEVLDGPQDQCNITPSGQCFTFSQRNANRRRYFFLMLYLYKMPPSRFWVQIPLFLIAVFIYYLCANLHT